MVIKGWLGSISLALGKVDNLSTGDAQVLAKMSLPLAIAKSSFPQLVN